MRLRPSKKTQRKGKAPSNRGKKVRKRPNDPQQRTIQLLRSLGYVLERNSLWPVYYHPIHGTRIQIDFSGRRCFLGRFKK